MESYPTNPHIRKIALLNKKVHTMVLEEKLAMRCRRFGRRVSVPNRFKYT